MSISDQIKPGQSIVILTGAGISAESGLATFRGSDGLWEGHRVEDVATPEGFARNPSLVHAFYNMRRRELLNPAVKPNPAHEALARLEQNWNGDVLLVTQNVDNLHERAGSKNLLHMHGEALRAFCQACGHNTAWQEDLSIETACPSCDEPGGLRPDIVWFGEMPHHMDKIFNALSDCDLFISIGTSGQVYPAAGFVDHARHSGAYTIECNLDPASNTSLFHEKLYGAAGTILPELVNKILATP